MIRYESPYLRLWEEVYLREVSDTVVRVLHAAINTETLRHRPSSLTVTFYRCKILDMLTSIVPTTSRLYASTINPYKMELPMTALIQ